jgi:S-adenosylmethionine synthetase
VIGRRDPVSIYVDTFGTEQVDPRTIERLVRELFDLDPHGFIRDLDLRRPVFLGTAAYGHFGRSEPEFTWEATDRADELRAAAS